MFYPARVSAGEVREVIAFARDHFGADVREWYVAGEYSGLVAEPVSRVGASRGTARLSGTLMRRTPGPGRRA